MRYGKAKRGQPPRRRNVASVMDWAVDAVQDYVENIRPRFGCQDHPVGHECDSSTAIYTHVSDDFMNTMLRKALSPALDPIASTDKDRR